jgi:predicted house-cleaning noncanonical NTP pyrophosphatase (MazG superfamily)
MKRRAFLQNKLWRDLAIEMLEREGSIVHWTQLDDERFKQELRTKLMEEAQEVVQSHSNEELRDELGDLLDVVDLICQAHGVSLEEVHRVRAIKRSQRGGYEGRKYVTIAEHLEGSFGLRYCLAAPNKYPEVEMPDSPEKSC